MMKWEAIGILFRETRTLKGYSVLQVQQMLRERYDMEISVKTIYGWETNYSHPSLEVFLALCDIFDLRNIGIFLEKDSYESQQDLTCEDEYLLQKYHSNS